MCIVQKIKQQGVGIVVLDFAAYKRNTFIHFAENVVGGIGPDFDESFFNEKFADFLNGSLFQELALCGNPVTNGAI
jgi:hypothetical protein